MERTPVPFPACVDNPFLYLLVMQLAPLLVKSFYNIAPSIATDFRDELDKVRTDVKRFCSIA